MIRNKIKYQYVIIIMYNSRVSVGSRARQGSCFRVSLGNNAPRYNSEVAIQRNRCLMSSTKNSEDAPDWMSRTHNYHFKQHNRNRSLFSSTSSTFKIVQQTDVYAGINKSINPEGQFNRLFKPRARTRWEMRNSTFQLQWPRPESELRKETELKNRSSVSNFENTKNSSSKKSELIHFDMPKYGYFESPLHRQKETPIKIGHPYLMNTSSVK